MARPTSEASEPKQIHTTPWDVIGLSVRGPRGGVGIAVLSHRLGQLRVSPVQVTAHRFHLTYLFALPFPCSCCRSACSAPRLWW